MVHYVQHAMFDYQKVFTLESNAIDDKILIPKIVPPTQNDQLSRACKIPCLFHAQVDMLMGNKRSVDGLVVDYVIIQYHSFIGKSPVAKHVHLIPSRNLTGLLRMAIYS